VSQTVWQLALPASCWSPSERRLTASEFQQLGSVPTALEWFTNPDNPRIRRAHQNDLEDFCSHVGLTTAHELWGAIGQ